VGWRRSSLIVDFNKGLGHACAHGFPKSKRSNITDKEKAALSLAPNSLINATDSQLAQLIKDGSMSEL